MDQPSSTQLFSVLSGKHAPWQQLAFSYTLHFTLLLASLGIVLLHPLTLESPLHDYHFIRLVETPPVEDLLPAPVRFVTSPVQPEPAQLALRPAEEPAFRPKPQLVSPPKVEIAAAQPLFQLPPSAPAIPRQLVKTNVFSTGSSAIPTVALPPAKVQTGGFGDPNGVPAKENLNRPVSIAQRGAFNLPVGPGYGNGTGGSAGIKAVVASAGFGSGSAIGDSSVLSNAVRGSVRQGSFGDAATASASESHKQASNLSPLSTPAEVTFKPTPVYTEEARRLRIEGEVLIQVVFESSGRLQILRVVRGLGHGLDESALKAAQQIRFKPATREGQPADATGVLHILFQLA